MKNKTLIILPDLRIGGAEKNGLSTHYHSFYIPFLIASAVVGFDKLHKKKFFANKQKFFYFFLTFLILFNNSHDSSNTKKIIAFKDFAPGFKHIYSSILYPLHN